MCGEKQARQPASTSRRGSPPRVRGKVPLSHRRAIYHRITPACAGKSNGAGASVHINWDHPRVCGEKTLLFARSQTMTGSPPRVRGKVRAPLAEKSVQGITPACAGKRRFGFAPAGTFEDHPRVCGEKKAV